MRAFIKDFEIVEDIPAYRFITSSMKDGDKNKTAVELTKQSWDPTFHTESELNKGDEVSIDLFDNSGIWKVEAGSEIRAGRPVGNGKAGKVIDRTQVEGLHTCGVALEAGQPGDIIEIWHNERLNGPVANNLLQSSGGGTAWNSEKTMDSVSSGLKAGSNVSTSYDDKNGQLTISATDKKFSGKWNDLSGVPNNFAPKTHGDSAHSVNYAEQSQVFSGNYSDLSGVSIPESDLAFNAASQSELFSGKWSDISNKPAKFPPEKHGDNAHTSNYAKQSEVFSGNWNDVTGKPSSYPPQTHGNGAHSSNYAKQSALSSLEQRVADLEAKHSSSGGGGSGGGQK